MATSSSTEKEDIGGWLVVRRVMRIIFASSSHLSFFADAADDDERWPKGKGEEKEGGENLQKGKLLQGWGK